MSNVINIAAWKERKLREQHEALIAEAEAELHLLDAAIAEIENDQ